MDQRDAKHDGPRERAAQLIGDLAPLGDVTSKSMFGGFGIFCSGVMFAMVDREGIVRLRADDETSSALVAAGGEKHDPMPYWSIGDDVSTNPVLLIEWAAIALATAQKAQTSKKAKK